MSVYPAVAGTLFISSAAYYPYMLYGLVQYGLGHVLSLLLVVYVLQEYATLPPPIVKRVLSYIKNHHSIVYLGTAPSFEDDEYTIHLCIPHGMMCIEQGALLADLRTQIGEQDVVLFVDKMLYHLQPLARSVIRLMGIPRILPLRHDTIQNCLRRRKQRHVAVLPGGFVETVGYDDTLQTIYTGTIPYWIKMCKQHGYALRVFHMYNGSDLFPQAGYGMPLRTWLATHKCPIVLPCGIREVSTFVVRTWKYSADALPDTVAQLECDLFRYLRLDQTDHRFPYKSGVKRYVLRSKL
jgi:hypothetical protein